MTKTRGKTTAPARPQIVLPAADYERLERLVARARRSRSERKLADLLAAALDRAEIVDRDEVDAAVVTMNSGVCFREEEPYQDRCVRLVYPGDEVGNPRRVSVLSPLGIALLGAREGQTIAWDDEDGRRREARVVRVVPFPAGADNDRAREPSAASARAGA